MQCSAVQHCSAQPSCPCPSLLAQCRWRLRRRHLARQLLPRTTEGWATPANTTTCNAAQANAKPDAMLWTTCRAAALNHVALLSPRPRHFDSHSLVGSSSRSSAYAAAVAAAAASHSCRAAAVFTASWFAHARCTRLRAALASPSVSSCRAVQHNTVQPLPDKTSRGKTTQCHNATKLLLSRTAHGPAQCSGMPPYITGHAVQPCAAENRTLQHRLYGA